MSLLQPKIDESISLKNKNTLFIKINAIDTNYPLACTHPEALDTVLSFFHSKFEQIIVGDNTFVLSQNESIYTPLIKRYKNIKFSNLMEYPTEKIEFRCINDIKVPVTVSLLPENAYTISLALPKTHDYFIYTGSSKNMFGCVIGERQAMHGVNGFQRLFIRLIHESAHLRNENMLKLLSSVRPDLSILDGYMAMEGNGPINGTGLKLGVALCGFDTIAVDKLMSTLLDLSTIPYLELSSEMGIGVSNLKNIHVLNKGFNDLASITKTAKPHYLSNYHLNSMDCIEKNRPIFDLEYVFQMMRRSYRIKPKVVELFRSKFSK